MQMYIECRPGVPSLTDLTSLAVVSLSPLPKQLIATHSIPSTPNVLFPHHQQGGEMS